MLVFLKVIVHSHFVISGTYSEMVELEQAKGADKRQNDRGECSVRDGNRKKMSPSKKQKGKVYPFAANEVCYWLKCILHIGWVCMTSRLFFREMLSTDCSLG